MGNHTNSSDLQKQKYELPVDLQQDMQALEASTKESRNKKDIFSRTATYLAALVTALTFVTTTPAFSQSKDKPSGFKIESIKSCNTLTFALNNADKYYPGMKAHLEEMLIKLPTPEWKAAVDKILTETVMKAADDKQKVGGCIYSIETYAVHGKTFGDQYDKDITDDTFALMGSFNTKYDIWFDGYLKELDSKLNELEIILTKNKDELAKNKDELAKSSKELENTINSTSPEDVKKNPKLKEIVKKAEGIYKKRDKPISPHFQSLIAAAK